MKDIVIFHRILKRKRTIWISITIVVVRTQSLIHMLTRTMKECPKVAVLYRVLDVVEIQWEIRANFFEHGCASVYYKTKSGTVFVLAIVALASAGAVLIGIILYGVILQRARAGYQVVSRGVWMIWRKEKIRTKTKFASACCLSVDWKFFFLSFFTFITQAQKTKLILILSRMSSCVCVHFIHHSQSSDVWIPYIYLWNEARLSLI